MTTATPETPAAEPAKPTVNLDEFGKGVVERLIEQIEEHNVLAKRVKAASGDPLEVLDALRDDPSVDPEVAKYSKAIDELDEKREALWAKRDELLKPFVEKVIAEGKEGLGDAEAKATEIAKVIKSGKDYLLGQYGEDALTLLPAVVGKRRASGGTGATGQRRIRGFDVYIDGTLATARDSKGGQTSNLAAAAKELGIDTEDLRKAFWEAAGTDDPKQYPKEVTFTVTIDEGEGDEVKSVTKTIVAKKVAEGEARATETEAPAA